MLTSLFLNQLGKPKEMEVDMGEGSAELNNSVMCQLADPEGTPLGVSMYLPQSVGPKELQQMVNKLLDNVNPT